MNIRHANPKDLPKIMEIYAYARDLMKKTGNPLQWKDTYPTIALIESDIEKGECFVGEDIDHKICCVFAFIIGQDRTYAHIEDGQWLNNETYGTIHRIASSGRVKNVLSHCVDYCCQQTDNIRIDTHRDNRIMQHQMIKNGFKYCGIIHVEDGSERLAYQWVIERKEMQALK